VKSVHDKIAAQVNERIDRVEGNVISSSKELLTKLTQDAQATRDTATQIVGSARSDYDKELTTFKTSLAGDIQKMREENKVQLEELKKFMDNQLRELYPYAYQPRRESKAPPEPDTK
jgi:F0F1-type ATP synthase membrane subunit b/b'